MISATVWYITEGMSAPHGQNHTVTDAAFRMSVQKKSEHRQEGEDDFNGLFMETLHGRINCIY